MLDATRLFQNPVALFAVPVNASVSALGMFLKEGGIHPQRGAGCFWHVEEVFRQADVVVLATPLSFFSVSTQMKNFMDRLIPLVEPYGVKRGDGYTHGPRYKEQWLEKKAVIISNSGFPERQHFAGLVETFRQASAWLPEFESAAVILCPAGEIFRLSSDPETEKKLKSYVDAARSAGREMVVQGRIGPETQKVLDGDILEPEAYSRVAHTFFNSITIR